MGTKYSSNAASGYNSTPPADDGTVSEANKIKWSAIKTKLADPVKDLADTINSELATHFDRGPTAITTNTTLAATHYNQFIQASGSGVTLTLTDAATLGAAWFCDVANTDSSNSITLARATASNTINSTSADISILPLQALRVFVNAATTGFVATAQPLHSNEIIFSSSGYSPSYLKNYSLAASVGSSALTITLSGYDGTALAANNKAEFAFRSATAGTGTHSVVSATANLTLTISSGSTMGTTSGVASRIWVVLFNDAGTLRLGAINCSKSTNIYPLADDILASSTAEGGAGGADSAGVIYTGSAVTSKAMRVLGYVESTQATAGTWATTPSKVQLWQQGMKLPGDVVQIARTATGTMATGTTTVPQDNTIPQNTEGDQYMSVSITPSAAPNVLKISARFQGANTSANTTFAASIFQDSTANALATSCYTEASANFLVALDVEHMKIAGTTSATTFNLRAGGNNGASTTTFNGYSGAAQYGGVINSFLEVLELVG